MPGLQNLVSFKTGHPGIDADHARLAEIIDAINDAVGGDGDPLLCRHLLVSFIDAARQHFADEEAILLDMGFPGFKRHCLYHDELLEQAITVKRNCDVLMERRQLRTCFEEMARFFIDDVIRGDMEFVSFMQERGIVPPARRL